MLAVPREDRRFPALAYGVRAQLGTAGNRKLQVPPQILLCDQHLEGARKKNILRLTGETAPAGECEVCKMLKDGTLK
jgi:hypothetical protein